MQSNFNVTVNHERTHHRRFAAPFPVAVAPVPAVLVLFLGLLALPVTMDPILPLFFNGLALSTNLEDRLTLPTRSAGSTLLLDLLGVRGMITFAPAPEP